MSNENITVARRLKDGTLVRVMPDGTTQPFPDEEMDWAAFDALTEEQVQAAALSDPDCPPMSEEHTKKFKRVYTTRFMRRALGLTQEEFAAKFRIPRHLTRLGPGQVRARPGRAGVSDGDR